VACTTAPLSEVRSPLAPFSTASSGLSWQQAGIDPLAPAIQGEASTGTAGWRADRGIAPVGDAPAQHRLRSAKIESWVGNDGPPSMPSGAGAPILRSLRPAAPEQQHTGKGPIVPIHGRVAVRSGSGWGRFGPRETRVSRTLGDPAVGTTALSQGDYSLITIRRHRRVKAAAADVRMPEQSTSQPSHPSGTLLTHPAITASGQAQAAEGGLGDHELRGVNTQIAQRGPRFPAQPRQSGAHHRAQHPCCSCRPLAWPAGAGLSSAGPSGRPHLRTTAESRPFALLGSGAAGKTEPA